MILSQLQRVGKTLAEEQKLDSVLCFEHVLITWSVTLLFFLLIISIVTSTPRFMKARDL